MPHIDIPDVIARTTSDLPGHPHMIVAATGEGPMDALGLFAAQAGEEAGRITDGFREDPDYRRTSLLCLVFGVAGVEPAY